LHRLWSADDNLYVRRVAEPELMVEPSQARAYAEADFAEPHARFVDLLGEKIGADSVRGWVLDLGCGPADVTIRFARAFPDAFVHGMDGSEVMLEHGRSAVERAGLSARVELYEGRFPEALFPRDAYDGVFSNSLLHHLQHPSVLWQTVKRATASEGWLFVMDLMRPRDKREAQQLVDRYAANEPEVLRRDFYNSLLAAYREDEIARQLRMAKLDYLETEVVRDRHFIVWGRRR
jgi:ubiquinone/menaquinone biosynthesis C-methylase UbiE